MVSYMRVNENNGKSKQISKNDYYWNLFISNYNELESQYRQVIFDFIRLMPRDSKSCKRYIVFNLIDRKMIENGMTIPEMLDYIEKQKVKDAPTEQSIRSFLHKRTATSGKVFETVCFLLDILDDDIEEALLPENQFELSRSVEYQFKTLSLKDQMAVTSLVTNLLRVTKYSKYAEFNSDSADVPFDESQKLNENELYIPERHLTSAEVKERDIRLRKKGYPENYTKKRLQKKH